MRKPTKKASLKVVQDALRNYATRMEGVTFRLRHIENTLHGLHMDLSDENEERIDVHGLLCNLEILASYLRREGNLLDTMYCLLGREIRASREPKDPSHTNQMPSFLEIYGQSEYWESFDPLYGENYEDDPFELFKRHKIPARKKGGQP
jgi:hypothetical protein